MKHALRNPKYRFIYEEDADVSAKKMAIYCANELYYSSDDEYVIYQGEDDFSTYSYKLIYSEACVIFLMFEADFGDKIRSYYDTVPEILYVLSVLPQVREKENKK